MHHDTLLDQLAGWSGFTAVVVGDVMVDEFVYGNADRLSAESPVPILDVQRAEARAGGAANLCLALAALHGRVRTVGLSGADPEAAALRELLGAADVETEGLIEDAGRPTTVKRRFVGLAQHRHPQMMFRADRESREPAAGDVEERLLRAFDAALEGADVVCLEDYAKGVCTPRVCAHVIEKSRAAGVPVLVDPAAVDVTRYRGATAMTPNRTEAARAVAGRVDPVGDHAGPLEHGPVARALVELLEMEAVLVTLDRHGALLLERDRIEAPEHVPTVARQVYDVTGAGDVVLAALAAGRANGLSWHDSARLANAAAGLKVERFGAVPVPIEDVHADLVGRRQAPGEKVKPVEQLAAELRGLRGPGGGAAGSSNGSAGRPTVVFTNGCFDILHAGHLSLLKRSAEQGDYLVVAINSDASVRRLGKGPDRPINNEKDRAALLSGLECVDAVVVFDEDTPERVIRELRPDVLVKGAEYSLEQIPGAEFVLSIGGRVERLTMVEGKSTTGTVERIRGKG